jgi:hypothetical protein
MISRLGSPLIDTPRQPARPGATFNRSDGIMDPVGGKESLVTRLFISTTTYALKAMWPSIMPQSREGHESLPR